MNSPNKVAKCIETLKNNCTLPVTIKHRIGIDNKYDFNDLNEFVKNISNAGADRFIVHARQAILKGLNPKQNRTIPPLRYDIVKELKDTNPDLFIEINGGFTNIEECIKALNTFDGVMIGRSAYKHPFRWTKIDNIIYGEKEINKKISKIIFSLIPYINNHLEKDGRSWDICKHLINLVESIPKAKIWRNKVTKNSIEGRLTIENLINYTQELKDLGY